jgi:hypothetical protein
MSEVAIVYLARARSGLESLRRFLRSYERYPGGLEHDLVVVFKGFSQQAELAEWRTALSRFPHRELRMSDFGFDIRAYSLAARRLPHRYLCFLNSFSKPLPRTGCGYSTAGWWSRASAWSAARRLGQAYFPL